MRVGSQSRERTAGEGPQAGGPGGPMAEDLEKRAGRGVGRGASSSVVGRRK